MTVELLYAGQVVEYEPVVIAEPPDDRPAPVPEPLGMMTERGDDYAVVLHDASMDDRSGDFLERIIRFLTRSTLLSETNETAPNRPVIDGRVSPQGKIIVPLDKGNGPVYWQWMVDLLGDTLAEKVLVDGNGYFDTSPLWDMMCSATGGSLVHVTDSILQSGTWWDIVETLDFRIAPEKVGGVWHYKGRPITFERAPHLMTVLCNRRKTEYQSWMTQGGITTVSRHGNGFEHWPLFANAIAAQPRYRLLRYPALPAMLHVYKDSLVVDGHLVERTGGIDIVCDAIKFSGANTYVRDLATGLWYVADEMLVQAQEPYSAVAWTDYRCYVPRADGKTPWMGHRGYRQPIADWQKE